MSPYARLAMLGLAFLLVIFLSIWLNELIEKYIINKDNDPK